MEYTIIINNNYKEILLKNNNEEISINLNKNIKVFHQDIVKYDKKTNNISIINSYIKKKNIVGILEINNKLIYGFNSKKNPYYLFKPLDNHYPNFYVAVNDKNLKNKNGKYYIVIKYNEWIKKLPYGIIIKNIGEIGEKNNEIEKLLYYYNIDTKNYKIDLKQNNTIYDIFNDDDLKNIIKKTDLKVYSIDPKNSKDIDDALSIQYINDNKKIIGIHIADVSSWFFKLNLDKYIKNNRYFTVYLKNKKYNLFPNILSDNLMSLLQNKDRICLSLYITYDKDNQIIEYKFENNIINVNKNYSYEKFNNILNNNDKERYKTFHDLFNLSKKINLSNNNEKYDSHNMIENYMILANKLTAEYLINNNKNPILRYHIESKYNIDFNNVENVKLKNFLKIFQTKSALYKIYNKTDNFNYYHYGLNLNLYTHFTSPIRRFVDIINHILIKKCIFSNFDNFYNDFNIDDININNKNLRKMDRELNEIEIGEKIVNKTVNGYLINYKKNFLYFYIPEYNLYIKKQIYTNDNLFKDIDFTISDNIFTIKNKINDNSISFFKYNSYNISITKLLKSNKFYYNLINYDFSKIIL